MTTYDDGIIYESPYKDWNGNPIERTPNNYRYSYDAYVVIKIDDKYEHCVYSDRLFQWDSAKYNKLCLKHFGNEGQYWDNRSYKKTQAFLRDYYNNQKLKLIGIMTGCNVSNGFPYWIFMFNCDFDNCIK